MKNDFNYNSYRVTAVITAAGESARMEGADKLFTVLDGIPVLVRSMLAFQNSSRVSDIIITCRKENAEAVKNLADEYNITKLKAITHGGKSRAESVLYGIAESMKNNPPDIIAVHDGARPLITTEKADAVICGAVKTGAAILAVPVKDTIKTVYENVIRDTPDRKTLYSAQTPQAFSLELYRRAVNVAVSENSDNLEKFTDDSLLFEAAGIPVSIIIGSYENLKITTPEDLLTAEAVLLLKSVQAKEEFSYGNNTNIQGETIGSKDEKKALSHRVGHGYDVHVFAINRRLVLLGVEIPHEKGLLGHSDADVAAHAVMDALLGALALGDIGKHFPDTSPVFKNADSMKLLNRVVALVLENGYEIGNLDVTIVAEKPKLAPYILKMRENLAAACFCHVGQISVKATTEEGLGLAGNGIGTHAVCLLDAQK